MLRALVLACLLSTALLAVPGAAAGADAALACNEVLPDCDDPSPGTCRLVGYDCVRGGSWCDYFVLEYCIHN